jgi:hypothetical protein
MQSVLIKSMDEDRAKMQKYIAKYERDVAHVTLMRLISVLL